MATIGQLGGLAYEIPLNQRMQQQAPVAGQVPPARVAAPVGVSDDPLASIEGVTNEYYGNAAMIQEFVNEMASKGINPFVPDYSQEGGGLAFQTMQKLLANQMYTANKLRDEQQARQQARPLMMRGDTRLAQGVDQSGFYASDPNNFIPTAVDPRIREANVALRDNRYTQDDSAALNQAVRDPLAQQYKAAIAAETDPRRRQALEYQLSALQTNTPEVYPGLLRPRNDGSNSTVGAYVSEFSEIASGNGFQPGERYDERGNRIDVARPASFVNRQWGFTPDGKKFILDRFERYVNPDGTYRVEMVDTSGNRIPVDPSNIIGSLRSFIETNEGAGALKDLNAFMSSRGIDPATQRVPATMFATPAGQSDQTSTAQQVQSVRDSISRSLDALSEGGLGRWLKNYFAVATGNYDKLVGTELKYTTNSGQELIVKKEGDKFTLENYQDLYPGGTKKGSQYLYDGKDISGEFKKIPKDRMLAVLEEFGVVNAKIKDSSGKETTVPVSPVASLTPTQQKAIEAFKKQFNREPTPTEKQRIIEKYK